MHLRLILLHSAQQRPCFSGDILYANDNVPDGSDTDPATPFQNRGHLVFNADSGDTLSRCSGNIPSFKQEKIRIFLKALGDPLLGVARFLFRSFFRES